MKAVILKIKMFGDFVIEYNDESVIVAQHLGKQLMNLLQILLLQHNLEVSKEFLMDTMWSDSENPNNAMKFTIFRLRNELKKLSLFDGLDLIVTTKNGYRMNAQYTYECDFNQFDHLYQQLGTQDFQENDLQKVQSLINLYQGHLYVTSSQLLWVTQQQEYYRGAFIWSVCKSCEYLLGQCQYQEMKKIAYNATLLDPFVEDLHYYYMCGLVGVKDYYEALKYYDKIDESFYKVMGSGLSARFKDLYDLDAKEFIHSDILNMEQFHRTLDSQNNNRDEAFYCSYDLFKNIYELSLRSAVRERKRYFLVLFKIETKESPDKQVSVFNKLKSIIMRSLRSSDIVAKVNNTQIVILVDCKEEDNTYLIVQRITSQFYKKCNQNKFRLHYSVEEAKIN